jgi:hypothetical protein
MPGSDLRTDSPAIDHCCPELLHLVATAVLELAMDVGGPQRRCHQCRAPWPCAKAELAAFTLDAW